ncbi:hypothetical protein GH714_025428 [Hevea brasiliensis]|uniref:3-deoxy-manno-octulosonate cytidylyltransferase n=1 Tax=Hevea brasiliensis TaxID=3981 RepID=A0A6A6MKR4_HEVBR|nr:hypothetical protein GH714_025428 [Hevea brasiliensis]
MSVCSFSSSSSSSLAKLWIVHGIVAGAAIAAGLGARAYLVDDLQRTWERAKLATTLDHIGDEPLIEPEIIDGIVKALQTSPNAVFSTAVTSLKPEDAFNPNRVKCVVDNLDLFANLIQIRKVNPQFPYLLHLGIQSYNAKFLKIYPELQPTPLQLEEDLEQLKVLENGYKKKTVIKVDHEAHGVHTPEDVEKIETLMRERNLS